MSEERLVPKLRFSGFDDEWKKLSLIEISQKIGDGMHATPKYVDDSNYYFINGNNLDNKNIVITDNTKCVPLEEYEKYKINFKNTILISINGTIGNLAYYNGETVILGKSAAYINLNENINKEFVFNYLQIGKIKYYFNSELTGSTIKNLSLKTLKNTKIHIPSDNAEINKISNFLENIDNKIQLLKEKHQKYLNFKKYLMQQIFAQKLRFDKSNKNQKEIQLDNVISIINKRNKDDQNLPVLSISNKLGFISQSEQFEDREVASSDKKNYKIVNKGEFAYNPARINVGSIAQLKTYEKGIISPMYIVFKLDSTQLNPTFFENFLDSDYFRYEMIKRLEGSVRMILSAESLKNIKITVPPIEEQENLSKVFLAFDKEIEIIKHQLEKMQEFKKGLLQQMFV